MQILILGGKQSKEIQEWKEILLKYVTKEPKKKTNKSKKEVRQDDGVNQGNTNQTLVMIEKSLPFPNSSS